MPLVQLARGCAIDELAKQLDAAGALDGGNDVLVISFPHGAAIHPSALTFLCAWGRQQAQAGRRLLFRGDAQTESRLQQLNLYEHMGLAYQAQARAASPNPFVPLRLIASEHDMEEAANEISALVQKHFVDAAAFHPAVRWVISELLDNVSRHANATAPGAVFAEYAPRQHRLDVAICDLGRGIYASLSEAASILFSHGHAISQALRRGVTRSKDIGQGNGLAGLLEIVQRNGGSFQLWTGNAVYRVENGVDKKFTAMPELPGTGVAFSLDTRVAVNLQDTWIARADPTVSRRIESGAPGWPERSGAGPAQMASHRVIQVAQASSSTGMRAPAQRLREQLLRQLMEDPSPLTLDFAGVDNATSSFLDELLGRLAVGMGPELFARRIQVVGMSDLLEDMAEVVIRQRTEGATGLPLVDDGGNAR